ncbi:MAG: hypothetical protein ABH817_00930 [archaeon]
MVKLKEQDKIVITFLKELIQRIVGKNVEELVDFVFDKKDVNEFKIADKLKLTINQVRHILYKLSDQSILTSNRKKDKKKGWYTYFWTLDIPKSLAVLLKFKEKEIEVFENILKSRQTKTYYTCPNACMELSEEGAMHHNFFCPECGLLLKMSNPKKRINELINKLDNLKKQKNIIAIEVERVTPKPVPPKPKKRKVRKKVVKKTLKKKIVKKKNPKKSTKKKLKKKVKKKKR